MSDKDQEIAKKFVAKYLKDEDRFEEWGKNMSYNFYLIAKETGVTPKPNSNLIQIFDLLDNLETYSEICQEARDKS